MAESRRKRSAVFSAGIAECGKKHYHRERKCPTGAPEKERRNNEPILI